MLNTIDQILQARLNLFNIKDLPAEYEEDDYSEGEYYTAVFTPEDGYDFTELATLIADYFEGQLALVGFQKEGYTVGVAIQEGFGTIAITFKGYTDFDWSEGFQIVRTK